MFSTIYKTLIGLFLSTLVFVILSTMLSFDFIDSCHVDRFQKDFIKLSSFPFMYFTFVFLCLSGGCFIWDQCSVQLVRMKWYLYSTDRNDISFHYLFISFTTYVCFLSFHFLCETFKNILNDYKCNNKANSVSGHMFFCCFWIILFCMILLMEKSYRQFRPSWMFVICFFGLCLSSLLTLYQTYFDGYHSLRQMILGLMFVSLACLSWLVIIDPLYSNNPSMEERFYYKAKLPILSFRKDGMKYVRNLLQQCNWYQLVCIQVIGLFVSSMISLLIFHGHRIQLPEIMIGYVLCCIMVAYANLRPIFSHQPCSSIVVDSLNRRKLSIKIN